MRRNCLKVFRTDKLEQSMIGHSRNTSESWKNLPWKQFQKDLFRLQKRVYKAIQVGDTSVSNVPSEVDTQVNRSKSDGSTSRVESRGDIIPRPSHLDPSVRLSPHSAPDVLSFRFCSCGLSHGSFRGWLEGFQSSSFCGYHLCDVNAPFHPS